MVDFNKVIHNSNKFREPALRYEEFGEYCPYPKNTTEYFDYWNTQSDRCLNGYTAPDGDFITGYHYFYLNFCPINRISYIDQDGKKVRVSDTDFPDFYDYDYFFFQAINDAETAGKHMVVAKSRRKGYSLKCASMLCRNFYMIPESKSYVYASDKQFLTGDGILTKAWSYLDFIDENTAWGKKRQAVNSTMHRRASFYATDEYGNKMEVGYKSEIIGASIKDKPDKVRGKRAKLILFEEAGTFKELQAAWQIARPSVEHDGIAFGLMIAFGTGGSSGEDIRALKTAFYDPQQFNCIGFENIWDEGLTDKQCGFFVPQHSNLDVRDENGKRLYMDKDGNTLHSKAKDFILAQRTNELQNATDSMVVDRYIAEYAENPMEAFMELSGNIFPKKDLQLQLARIRTNRKLQNHKQVGELITDEKGVIRWIVKKGGDITKYPLPRTEKSSDVSGSIVIWEHPVPDAPFGLYLAGCLTPGEQVLTDIGLMDVQDVDLNRKLINSDGKFVDIVNLQRYDKVNEDTYRIRVANTYRTTNFTSEHPIYISRDKCATFNFTKAKDVQIGDWIKYPNVYKNTTDYDYSKLWNNTEYRIDRQIVNPINDPDFWWFIGLWLGDGWCESNGYKIAAAFNLADTNYITKYTNIVSKLFNRKVSSRIRGNCVELAFSFQQLNSFLTDNFGKYCYGKYIPEWAKRISEKLKINLILGYLASDGCVWLCKRGYVQLGFVSINHNLLESVQDIMFSIGYVTALNKLRSESVHTFVDKTCKTKLTYQLRMRHTDSVKFITTYCDLDDGKFNRIDLTNIKYTRRSPKRDCYLDDKNEYIYFQIKNIQQDSYSGTVYNFECDTHTFLTKNITTHNCDPYDHDQSGTNSLGSTFIYKRHQDFESYSDMIVAEYTGRPATAEDYYENVRKLLMYYNARCMYENMNKGVFTYFVNKHCDYLLADQPDILNDVISGGKSTVARRKGCHMTKEIKLWGEGLIKEWLIEELAPGVPRLSTILSEPFLEELISYNDRGNFDRVMAYMQVMIYKEQLYRTKVKRKNVEERSRRLFDKPLFGKSWFDEDNQPLAFNSTQSLNTQTHYHGTYY
jgi:intein/homing endonuclease